jgi:hypothetical protein
MSSGKPHVVQNTLERIVSTDFNRAQALLDAATQESWRARYGQLEANWRLYPGIADPAATVAAPAYGDVFAGLFVRPDAGTYLTIDAGLAMMFKTPTNSDDSPYAFCQDPGVSNPASLPFVANGSAGTVRWDIVECQPTDTLLESQSVDIYVPATGLFGASNLPKLRANRMTYRYRQGTAGSGYPGAAADWMPLVVVAVRDGATSFAQCDLYDVRPLVSERTRPQPIGTIGNEGYSPIAGGYFETGASLIVGFSEAEFGGYLAGGALKNSVVPSTLAQFGKGLIPADIFDGGDAPGIYFSNSDMRGPMSGASQAFFHIVALFPTFANQAPLPRWARYCEAPDPVLGRRVPNGPRGIVILTTTAPGPNGLYAPIAFPSSMQLVVNGVGVCLGAIEANSQGGLHTNRRYQHQIAFNSGTGAGNWKIAASSTTADTAEWNLSPGVHYPTHAKSLRCSFRFDYNGAFNVPNSRANVRSVDSQGGTYASFQAVIAQTTQISANPSKWETDCFDIPICNLNNAGSGTYVYPYPPGSVSPVTWKVQLFFQTTGTFVDAFLHIHGWEF